MYIKFIGTLRNQENGGLTLWCDTFLLDGDCNEIASFKKICQVVVPCLTIIRVAIDNNNFLQIQNTNNSAWLISLVELCKRMRGEGVTCKIYIDLNQSHLDNYNEYFVYASYDLLLEEQKKYVVLSKKSRDFSKWAARRSSRGILLYKGE